MSLKFPIIREDDYRKEVIVRMQEQDNWGSYQIILQRLQNFVDAPYDAHHNGVGAEDESQLYDLIYSTITYLFDEQAREHVREQV